MCDSPLIFERRPGGRIVVLLGILPIGEITPSSYGASFDWFLSLPLLAHINHNDSSLEACKTAMRFKVDYWLEAAQLSSIAKRPEGEIRCWRWDDAKEAVRGMSGNSAREKLESEIADIIAEHVAIRYELGPNGLVDPNTIGVGSAIGAATMVVCHLLDNSHSAPALLSSSQATPSALREMKATKGGERVRE